MNCSSQVFYWPNSWRFVSQHGIWRYLRDLARRLARFQWVSIFPVSNLKPVRFQEHKILLKISFTIPVEVNGNREYPFFKQITVTKSKIDGFVTFLPNTFITLARLTKNLATLGPEQSRVLLRSNSKVLCSNLYSGFILIICILITIHPKLHSLGWILLWKSFVLWAH